MGSNAHDGKRGILTVDTNVAAYAKGSKLAKTDETKEAIEYDWALWCHGYSFSNYEKLNSVRGKMCMGMLAPKYALAHRTGDPSNRRPCPSNRRPCRCSGSGPAVSWSPVRCLVEQPLLPDQLVGLSLPGRAHHGPLPHE